MIANQWAEWYPKLMKQAWHLGGPTFNTQDAEDLVAMAVEKGLRAEARGQDVGYGYLYYALKTLAIDRSRKPFTHQLLHDNHVDPRDRPDWDATNRAYVEWLLGLMTPTQEVAFRTLASGGKYRDLAGEIGLAESSFKKLLARGKERIAGLGNYVD